MIEKQILNSKCYKKKTSLYFAHFVSLEKINKFEHDPFYKSFIQNITKLQQNDWELHKKLVEEGINPNEIAKAIRYDEIEKLQEISSENDFDFNQTIKPSLYERYSFINQENVSLINYSAFFGSVKCFKYLLLNNSKLTDTGKYAIAGGNLEIIHLCEQNHVLFKNDYEIIIEFHRNEILKYFFEKKLEENQTNDLEELGKKCILFNNFNTFSFLMDNGMKIDESLIIESINTGNIFLAQYLLGINPISINFPKLTIISWNDELFSFLVNNKYIDLSQKSIY